jgi:hypothetical protein
LCDDVLPDLGTYCAGRAENGGRPSTYNGDQSVARLDPEIGGSMPSQPSISVGHDSYVPYDLGSGASSGSQHQRDDVMAGDGGVRDQAVHERQDLPALDVEVRSSARGESSTSICHKR